MKTAEEMRDTLVRIASEFRALYDDSEQNDSVGEIYHLLREAGILDEDNEIEYKPRRTY